MLLLGFLASVVSADSGNYKLGDAVREDIFAPSQLIVVNPERTAELKNREASKIPAVYRYVAGVADEAETTFRKGYLSTRTAFLREFGNAFPSGSPRDAVTTEAFVVFVASFQRTNQGFPVNHVMATTWAMGQGDRVVQASCAAALREALDGKFVVPEAFESPAGVRIVRAPATQALTLEAVTNSTEIVSAASLVTLKQAEQLLLSRLGVDDTSVQRYVVSLLRPNCLPETAITTQLRATHVDRLWAADRYEPGQLIASSGQIVDSTILAALNQVRERSAIGHLQEQRREDLQKAQKQSRYTGWIIGTLISILVILSVIVWRVVRSRHSTAIIPASPQFSGFGHGAVNVTVNSPEMGGGVVTQVGEVLKDRVVRALVEQRAGMLEAQQTATMEVAELEARLDRVHAPIKDRLRAYEERIAELEQELKQKGDENREMIRAKIRATKQQIEAMRERLDFS